MLQAYGASNLINFSTSGGAPIIKHFGFDQDPLGARPIVRLAVALFGARLSGSSPEPSFGVA
jgi:hypothetical protein